jgi:hypothetical protein
MTMRAFDSTEMSRILAQTVGLDDEEATRKPVKRARKR